MDRVGKNRKTAERALRKINVQIDDDVFEPQLNIRFEVWGPRWRESLERKETTKDGYRGTIAYAVEVFREVQVRRLRPAHLARLNEQMKERKLSASTRAKHTSASSTRVCRRRWSTGTRRRCRSCRRGERPRATKREAAYFTNDEIPRLFEQVPDGVYQLVSVSRGGLLIPRSQVRSLPGPFKNRLQTHLP
jgi:hypothetical protein